MEGLRNSRFTSTTTSQGRASRSWQGFTIVELLIVVVVIAILAAITIVAYNGITANANESALKSDLTTAAKKLHVAKIDDGSFPGTKPGFMSEDLSYTGGGNAFCVTGSTNGKDFRLKESGGIEEGDCAAPSMQAFTNAQCSALPVFTGSNDDAVIQLTDSRGGTTQTYEVAKLADHNCWMLTNLKLGSTAESLELTPAASDVSTNFTLPQIVATGSNSYYASEVIGPVPGDTGSGETNYGYLYNWTAATAGETLLTMSSEGKDAPHSICPLGWRLPSGGSTDSDFGQLDIAYGGTGSHYVQDGPSTSSWQPSGPFRMSFAGHFSTSVDFYGQGSQGQLWSASNAEGHNGRAHLVRVTTSGVNPGANGSSVHYLGYSIRCLLR